MTADKAAIPGDEISVLVVPGISQGWGWCTLGEREGQVTVRFLSTTRGHRGEMATILPVVISLLLKLRPVGARNPGWGGNYPSADGTVSRNWIHVGNLTFGQLKTLERLL